jgi:hypothetical protein
MPKQTVPAQEQLSSTLRKAPNRLEYLTPNDWALLIDRTKEVTFQKDEILIKKGTQAKMIYFVVKGTARIEADFKGESRPDWARTNFRRNGIPGKRCF